MIDILTNPLVWLAAWCVLASLDRRSPVCPGNALGRRRRLGKQARAIAQRNRAERRQRFAAFVQAAF